MYHVLNYSYSKILTQSIHTFSNYLTYTKCCVSCNLEYIEDNAASLGGGGGELAIPCDWSDDMRVS